MSSWSNVRIHRQVQVQVQELLLLKSVPCVKPRACNLCLQYVKILRPESKAIKAQAVQTGMKHHWRKNQQIHPNSLTWVCDYRDLEVPKLKVMLDPDVCQGDPWLSSCCLNQNAENHGLAVSSNQLPLVIKHSLVYTIQTLKTTHTLDVFFPGDEYQNAFQPKRLFFCLR